MDALRIRPDLAIPVAELRFEFVRSGGPGGQNVNKVATKVDILFDVRRSASLTEDQKGNVLERLSSRIGKDGLLRVAAQESRSQWRNRELALEKLARLLSRALTPRKKRFSTRPTAGSREKRFRRKKLRSETKRGRRKLQADD